MHGVLTHVSCQELFVLGGHADRRADFVTLAKENRVFRMGRFAWPFRRTKGPLLYFCRWCATICAPRGWFHQLFGQDGRYSFALSLGKLCATAQRPHDHATRPTVRIGLSTSRGRLVPLLAVLCHDPWCTPSGLPPPRNRNNPS